MTKKKLLYAVLLLIACAGFLFISATTIPGLTTYKLDNGLGVYIVENHTVPLATVQITFNTGAISQDKTNCGLFHLYEHMLFKGNSKYKNAGEMMSAMNKLGVSNWNGGTSQEYVTYYFTLPSYNLEKGIEFWSYAVKSPLLDEKEMIAERDVVANEINANLTNGARIFSGALNTRLFFKYPWRKDTGGSIPVIKNATVQQLTDIKNRFYVPNNAAIFIGGDVNPVKVLELVKKYYGDWKKGDDPWKTPLDPHPVLDNDSNFIYADDSFYPNYGYVMIKMRGPDVLVDTKDTYTADTFLFLMQSPVGKFKTALMDQCDFLLDPEYMDISYFTEKDGGELYFYAYFDSSGGSNLTKINTLKQALTAELKKIAMDPNYFSKDELELAKTKLSDQYIYTRESASDFVSTLSDWWAISSPDYFLGYEDNCRKVTIADIQAFIGKYFIDKKAVTGIRISTKQFKNDSQTSQENLAKYNYEVVTPDNAFWWSLPIYK